MIISGLCCKDCAGGPPRGLGWGWDDLNPITFAKDAGNALVDAVGDVAMNVVTKVDTVTKKTFETTLSAGQTVRQLSQASSSGSADDIPGVSYLPLAVGGVAAAGLLLWAFSGRKKTHT